MEEYTTRELTKEEGDALTKDLQEVLKKHNAEMGVVSSIQLLKRVEITKDIVSPFVPPHNGEHPDQTTESSNPQTT